MDRKRRRGGIALVVAVALGLVGLAAGAAVAMLGGLISGTNLATGVASGQGSPCQTSPMNFTFVDPQWRGNSRSFNIDQVAYEDFSADCVSASARLQVVVTAGNRTLLQTELVPTQSSGTLDLETPLNSNQAADAEINYLVQG